MKEFFFYEKNLWTDPRDCRHRNVIEGIVYVCEFSQGHDEHAHHGLLRTVEDLCVYATEQHVHG